MDQTALVTPPLTPQEEQIHVDRTPLNPIENQVPEQLSVKTEVNDVTKTPDSDSKQQVQPNPSASPNPDLDTKNSLKSSSTEAINTEKSEPEDSNENEVNVAELTTQIMEIISQDDGEVEMTQTGLLKKNVELQEFMVKLIELLKEKTNLSANLERQNSALSNQAKSLRDVIAITKDLLNIRNMEVEHLHVDMAAMDKNIKDERERNNLAIQRLTEAMSLNDKLKKEYLNQMELFGKLRDKYNEKVALLMKENQNLKELLKAKAIVETSSEDAVVEAAQVPEETTE